MEKTLALQIMEAIQAAETQVNALEALSVKIMAMTKESVSQAFGRNHDCLHRHPNVDRSSISRSGS
jgi:hypothetical protein